jgi:pyridoxamine 5'-phosphate oxidase
MTTLRALIDRFDDAMRAAADAGLHLPNGCTLATVGPDERPSSRIVLLKEADERGFVFYTNLSSRKSRELESNPNASLCFWWPELEVQIRVEGTAERVGDDEADGYWKTRPRGSQFGAWASRQSEPLASHRALEDELRAREREYEGKPVPRPPFWSGFRLVPDRIEFWHGREDRLHERELFTRTDEGWGKQLLNP